VASPTRSKAFDRVADDYDRTRGGASRGEEVAAALEPLLPQDGVVLEIGVGTGLVGAALSRRGHQVVGLDLSLPMLRHASARMPGRVAAGDALQLPVSASAADAIVMIHVVHVVGDVDAAFREAARVLRPGGRLVVSAIAPGRPPASDVSTLIIELFRRLGFEEDQRPDDCDTVVAAARRHGLTPAAGSAYLPNYARLSPAEWVRRINARSASWMWDVDERVWQEITRPTLEALRRLPDQDLPRDDIRQTPLLAFDRSSAAPASR
jgi:ubiquinone/menaquinone biosynthesis C-methylase UbiE